MIALIQRMFELSAFPESLIRVHREPDSRYCTDIQSIAIGVRTVKVELVRFRFHCILQYLVLVHHEEGSAVIVHNEDIVAEDQEVGMMIAKLIERELSAIAFTAQNYTLSAMTSELVQTGAIVPVDSRLSTKIADAFVVQTTMGSFPTAEKLLEASKVKHEQ